MSFLEGLKRKSRYVIALQDYSPAEKSGNYLILQKGDLIILQQENTDAYTTGWCFGENDRTGKKGDFPAECVYLLPTMNKPPAEILVTFKRFNILVNLNRLLIYFQRSFKAIICITINGKSKRNHNS